MMALELRQVNRTELPLYGALSGQLDVMARRTAVGVMLLKQCS
jgi:hypothetical protein